MSPCLQGRGYVLDTLAEIRERRDAVMELEKSLMELHQVGGWVGRWWVDGWGGGAPLGIGLWLRRWVGWALGGGGAGGEPRAPRGVGGWVSWAATASVGGVDGGWA